MGSSKVHFWVPRKMTSHALQRLKKATPQGPIRSKHIPWCISCLRVSLFPNTHSLPTLHVPPTYVIKHRWRCRRIKQACLGQWKQKDPPACDSGSHESSRQPAVEAHVFCLLDCCFQNRISLCNSSDCPATDFVDQAGLSHRDLSACVLGLQRCMPPYLANENYIYFAEGNHTGLHSKFLTLVLSISPQGC